MSLVVTASCKDKDKANQTPDPAPAPLPAAAVIDAGTAPAPAPAAPAAFIPAKLDEKAGVLFAEVAGGTIDARAADGSIKKLKDGTVVEIDAVHEPDMGDDQPATATVGVGDDTYTVGAHQVLREDSLRRSPDGSVAVFHVIMTCGDLCHTNNWVVNRDGKRAALGGGVVDLVVAWRADGKELAVGSGSLWIVSLPELTVRAVEEYTAPAYAPNGTLYVRDADGSAFILAGTAKPKRVWKAPKPPESEDGEGEGEGEGDYGADDPLPVTFGSDGKPAFVFE